MKHNYEKVPNFIVMLKLPAVDTYHPQMISDRATVVPHEKNPPFFLFRYKSTNILKGVWPLILLIQTLCLNMG